MKSIGACVLMATVAMGSNIADKEKSTLEINWKNSKGETKTFKVNDIEKEFDPEQIKTKTFIQGNLLPIGFSEVSEKGSRCRGRKASCSVGSSCRKASYSSRKASCSYSKTKSFRSHSKGASCSFSKGKSHGVCKGSGYGSHSKGGYVAGGCDSGFCGSGAYERGFSKGSVCSYGKGSVCSVSRSKSKSVCGGKKYVIHHKPKYIIKKKFFPRKKQNKIHKYNKYNRSTSRCNDDVIKARKDYDKTKKKVNVSDLEKLLKLQTDNKNQVCVDRRSASKLRKNNEVSKYLKDQDSKYLKDNRERECSSELRKSCKNAAKKNKNHKKEHEKERQSSVEAQKSHNLVNLNHKANEALLMKEQDKDNLHSNDRVIEEFDKLEHFKKVEERCRSASKARHANVKKHQDMDKCQAQKSGQKMQEKRGRKKLRANLDKRSDEFCNVDKNCLNKDSQYLKDEKECSADRLRERSLSTKSSKSTYSANEDKLRKNKIANCDLVNNKNAKCKNLKDVCVNDDEDCYKRRKSVCSDNERRCSEKDAFFNDKDCNIC